jgi:hypothetical protein
MKQCPVCKAVYSDELQSFCLSDGTMLLSIPDEEETRVISSSSGSGNRMKINTTPPAETMPAFTPPIISHQQQQQSLPPIRSANSPLVGILAGLLVIVVICFVGFVAYTLLKSDDKASVNTKNSPTPTFSQTPNDETNKLKEQVTNLEKKIDDQRNQKTTTPVPPPPSLTPSQPANAARVNSPRDGFLALRSEPSAETGFRIMEIPHGATVNLISCQSYSSSVGSRRGRWCQVNYGGRAGWAFDAFLIY